MLVPADRTARPLPRPACSGPHAELEALPLQLRFLNQHSALVWRKKFTMRARLAVCGITPSKSLLAVDNTGSRGAVEALGFRIVVKPCDRRGSRNVATFLTTDDLHHFIDPLKRYRLREVDYGLAVHTNGILLVERYLMGQLVGCSTFTRDGRHAMRGLKAKLMFDAPSRAIRRSCFPSSRLAERVLSDHVSSILDAPGFDQGATHTETVVGEGGRRLIEVNPRLVGGQDSAHAQRGIGPIHAR